MWLKSGVFWLWLWSQIGAGRARVDAGQPVSTEGARGRSTASVKSTTACAPTGMGSSCGAAKGILFMPLWRLKNDCPILPSKASCGLGGNAFSRAQALLKLSPTDERYAKEWQSAADAL